MPSDSSEKPKGPKKPRASRRSRVVVQGILGIGLDNEDGHTRITKGDDFFLVGGSQETHEKMQDFTIRLTEQLKKRGKRIANTPIRELRDIVGDLPQ